MSNSRSHKNERMPSVVPSAQGSEYSGSSGDAASLKADREAAADRNAANSDKGRNLSGQAFETALKHEDQGVRKAARIVEKVIDRANAKSFNAANKYIHGEGSKALHKQSIRENEKKSRDSR